MLNDDWISAHKVQGKILAKIMLGIIFKERQKKEKFKIFNLFFKISNQNSLPWDLIQFYPIK